MHRKNEDSTTKKVYFAKLNINSWTEYFISVPVAFLSSSVCDNMTISKIHEEK